MIKGKRGTQSGQTPKRVRKLKLRCKTGGAVRKYKKGGAAKKHHRC